MAKIRLIWEDWVLEEDGVRIFRSTSPIDPNNLPEPLAEVPVGRGVYEDKTVVSGVTYHYFIVPFAGASLAEGVTRQATAQEELPRFLYSTDALQNDGTTASVTQKIPDCRTGDLIVAVGYRRLPVTSVTTGFTDAGAPPNGSYDQWTFAYWKTATGGESGTDFTLTCSGAGRMGLMIMIFRHDSQPIVCSTLALQRAPTGSPSGTPLAVTNGPKAALLLVAYSWVYATSADTSAQWQRDWSRGFPPFFPEWWAGNPRLLAQRYNSFLTEAAAGENVSITFTGNNTNATDSRSSIWLSIGT